MGFGNRKFQVNRCHWVRQALGCFFSIGWLIHADPGRGKALGVVVALNRCGCFSLAAASLWEHFRPRQSPKPWCTFAEGWDLVPERVWLRITGTRGISFPKGYSATR